MVRAAVPDDKGPALAEVRTEVETDPDDLVRLRPIGSLREVLG